MLHFAVPRSGHPDASIHGEASAKDTPPDMPAVDEVGASARLPGSLSHLSGLRSSVAFRRPRSKIVLSRRVRRWRGRARNRAKGGARRPRCHDPPSAARTEQSSSDTRGGYPHASGASIQAVGGALTSFAGRAREDGFDPRARGRRRRCRTPPRRGAFTFRRWYVKRSTVDDPQVIGNAEVAVRLMLTVVRDVCTSCRRFPSRPQLFSSHVRSRSACCAPRPATPTCGAA
jgi:hypothetical protein